MGEQKLVICAGNEFVWAAHWGDVWSNQRSTKPDLTERNRLGLPLIRATRTTFSKPLRQLSSVSEMHKPPDVRRPSTTVVPNTLRKAFLSAILLLRFVERGGGVPAEGVREFHLCGVVSERVRTGYLATCPFRNCELTKS